MSKDLTEAIEKRFGLLRDKLDERSRRLWAAAEAKTWGRGGVAVVSRQTGISRQAISNGIAELDAETATVTDRPEPLPQRRVRRAGGGRKKLTETNPELPAALEKLIDPATRGDPESLLRWSSKSLRDLAAELLRQGHHVGHVTVGNLLRQMGYSLQANRKTSEGGQPVDRDAQFQFIDARCREQQSHGNPVISVDTKKNELVGDFKNEGREYAPKGSPEEVRVHDFLLKELGHANPYSVYDVVHNEGWASVETDHDTATFAAESIRRWWRAMGTKLHPDAQRLQVVADGGGSNASRVRLWKVQLQQLAEELGIPIDVCHLPPGTSKWNKIEHRMLSFISMNWRGRPLVSHEITVSLIKSTNTRSGLRIEAEIDDNEYPPGTKITDEEMDQLNLTRDSFHGEWNYSIAPRQQCLVM